MAKRSRTEKTKAAEVDVAALQAALDQAFPDRRWLRVLALFRHTGVADAGQVREVTGLSRDQLDTLLRRFRELAGEEVLARVPFNVPRPGVRGRPPAVYKLGQAGPRPPGSPFRPSGNCPMATVRFCAPTTW